jgi:hypothetical protein
MQHFQLTPHRCRRAGFTFLELQVAFLLLALALAALGPMVVMQSRHLAVLEDRLDESTTYHLTPVESGWASRLGAAAVVTDASALSGTPAVTLIDQTDDGYTENDTGSTVWTTVYNADAYSLYQRRPNGGGIGDNASFTFNDVQAGYYEVFATWGKQHDNATDTPFTIYDDTTSRGLVRKSQRIHPDDVILDGVRWESLGLFPITSGILKVMVTDDSNGYVMADAIRIAQVQINDVEILGLNRSLTDDSVSLTVRLSAP